MPGKNILIALVLILIAGWSSPIITPAIANGGIVPSLSASQGFFNFLFGKRKKKTKKAVPAKKKVPAAPAFVEARKNPDAQVVAVFGDELGGFLQRGLRVAYADNPAVIAKSYARNGETLLHGKKRDVVQHIANVLEREKIDFVVVMMGLGEVKPLKVGAVTFATGDPEWQGRYKARLKILRDMVSKKGIRFFWVSMPPVRKDTLNADMAYLNAQTEPLMLGRGVRYIDIWDGFIDDAGKFTYRGPDMNGQNALLRLKRGTGFARAGRRKLAFYVEPYIARNLSSARLILQLPEGLDQSDEQALSSGKGVDVGIVLLREPEAGSEQLLLEESMPANSVTLSKKIVRSSDRAKKGRVDFYGDFPQPVFRVE